MVCRGTLLANGSAADTSYEWHVWCVKLRMRVPNALGGINLNASENVLDFGMMRLFSNFQLVYSQRVSHTKLKWCMISSSVRVVNQTVGRSSKLFCHSSHLKVFTKGTRIICKKNLVSICKKTAKTSWNIQTGVGLPSVFFSWICFWLEPSKARSYASYAPAQPGCLVADWDVMSLLFL